MHGGVTSLITSPETTAACLHGTPPKVTVISGRSRLPCSQRAAPPRQLPSCTEQSSSTGGPSITCEVLLLLAAAEGCAVEGAALLLGELSPEGSRDARPDPLKTNCVDEEAPPPPSPSIACAIACSCESSSSGSSASSARTC